MFLETEGYHVQHRTVIKTVADHIFAVKICCFHNKRDSERQGLVFQLEVLDKKKRVRQMWQCMFDPPHTQCKHAVGPEIHVPIKCCRPCVL